MTDWLIPFNRPTRTGFELDLIRESITSGSLAGDGPFTARCETMLAELVGSPRALLMPSCTSALELANLLLDVGPEDEIVVPSFAFPSTAAASALRGARIVFIDIREDTLNLDETLLEQSFTPRTKAIFVLHYAGVACQMDVIGRIASSRSIPIVEDNAHGLFGSFHGRPLGSFGALAAQSFHETKNITCGEGGALMINDVSLVERAEILREKGTNRKKFFRGEIDKYTWVDVGSSFLLSEPSAAFLASQLEHHAMIQRDRARIWQRYADELAAWADVVDARLPVVPEGCEHPSHLFYVLLPTEADRDALARHLKARRILGVFHYLPLHLSKVGREHGGQPGQCPVTEFTSKRLLRLPLFASLSEDEQRRVIEAVVSFSPIKGTD